VLTSNVSSSAGMVHQLTMSLYADEFNRRDNDWIIYLQDHRAGLIKNSNVAFLNEKDMVYYRYRLRKYLQEKHHLEQFELATMIANRFKTAMDFNLSTKYLFIPTASYVQDLRSSYKTIQIQLNKL